VARKVFITSLVSLIGMSVVAAAGIVAVGTPQYSDEFGVSTVVGSLASGKTLNETRQIKMA
jgi:hypothetical protein